MAALTTAGALVPPVAAGVLRGGLDSRVVSAPAPPGHGRAYRYLEDAALLLAVWIALPVAILVVGTPVAFAARLVIGVATGSW